VPQRACLKTFWNPYKTLIPTMYYLAVIGVLGMIAVYVMNVPDPLG